MIPKIYITQWKKNAPWNNDYQVEQDLVIERALVEIFSDSELKEQLAFRGGTALHKLFLKPQARYSEDIDLVQIKKGSIGDILTFIREKLEFLGTAKYNASIHNATLVYRFKSEAEPVVTLKLKIEINTREHYAVFGYKHYAYDIKSEWFRKNCKLTSYSVEELLSTKLRALYQRRKGRDLFDLYYAYQKLEPDSMKIIEGFKEYLSNDGLSVTSKEYAANMEDKILDSDFIGDTVALLRTEIEYDAKIAWGLVKRKLIEKLN